LAQKLMFRVTFATGSKVGKYREALAVNPEYNNCQVVENDAASVTYVATPASTPVSPSPGASGSSTPTLSDSGLPSGVASNDASNPLSPAAAAGGTSGGSGKLVL